jgi:aldehyde:ferredoxin oxidoreductase
MGSKKLKAVVAWGDKGVRVARPKEFMALADMKRDEIIHVPGWGLNYAPHGGGPLRPQFPKEAFYEGRVCKKACSVCFNPEFDIQRITTGRFAGLQGSSFYWVLRDFAGLLKIQDWREMVALEDLVNRTGLDYVTCFKMFSFLCKLYDRGIISKEDTDGLELKVGDYDCYAQMTDKILKRRGIFAAAADGWYVLGQRVGIELLDDFKIGFPVIKGGDGLLDARFSRLSPTTFGNVVFSKPQHTHAATHYFKDPSLYPGHDPEDVKPFLQTFDGIKWDFAARMATTGADFQKVFSEDDFSIGRFAKHAEDCKAVYNSLGLCDISPYGFKDPTRDIPYLAEAYSAATGITLSARELKHAGERVWNLNRLINVREGFGREDDRWPAQWVQNTETPIPLRSGPSYLVDWFGRRVTKEDLYQILDDYYNERGWDVETGIPTKEKVLELGLEDFD